MVIVSTELRHFGIIKFLFAGEFAATAFYIMDSAMETVIEMLRDTAIQRCTSPDQPEDQRTRTVKTIETLEHG